MIRIAFAHDNTPRVYIGGRRLHHGLVGVLMVAFGWILIWHDGRDFPWIGD